ncbi:MAG: Crp/Fnr family transcriptional regulator [Prevotella sp.]|nr:Crp/Fnr family transcriptional regulator [Prevotella sp.]
MDLAVIRALQACPLFTGLTKKEIETIMKGVEYSLVKYEKKEVYTKEGQLVENVDIVVTGGMSGRTQSSSGKCVKITWNTIGKLMTPASIFSGKNVPVTIETDRQTILLRMKPETLQKLFAIDQRIQMNFIRLISIEAVEMAIRVKKLTLYTVREKLASYLLDIAKRTNKDQFMIETSRQELANMFAIQKFSLQRVLSEFQKEGIIRTNRKWFTILDREKLKAYAGE